MSIEENTVLHLSPKDAAKFVEMMRHPPKPSQALINLLQRKSQHNESKVTKPEEIMAGTDKVMTYKEWTELLCDDFGKQIGVNW